MTALAWWTFVIAPALSVLLWLAYECVEAPLVDEWEQPLWARHSCGRRRR